MEVLLCHAPVAVMAYPGRGQLLELPEAPTSERKTKKLRKAHEYEFRRPVQVMYYT